MKRIWIAVLVIILGLTITASAMAQWGSGWGRRGFGHGNCWMGGGYGQLGNPSDLSVDQATRLNNLQREFLEETGNLRNDLMQKRLELQNLLIQPTPEQKAVMAKQKEINDLISKLSEKRTAYELETKKLFPSGSAPGFATPYRGYGYCPGPGYGYGKGWGTTGLGPRGGPCW